MLSFASLLRPDAPPLLGIDVSATALKLVELRRSRAGQWELLHCASEALAPGWVKDGQLEQFDEVATALGRLVKKSGSSTRRVALALPAAAVITKKINLPAGLSADELELQVESEAAQYLPFALADVSLDFSVIGPAPGAADWVEVLLVAARKEKVSDRLGLAEAAGLELVILDVESFAARLAARRAIQALPNQGRNALVALVEIGARRTSLQVICDDELLFEREQNVGGAQLTALLARHYGISPEEAETRKRSLQPGPDYPTSVLQPYLEQVGQDVGRALQFFFTSTAHNRVDHVLLAGGGAALPGLERAVTQQTSYPCSVADPFAGMEQAQAALAPRGALPNTAFLVATGLAMRRYPT